MSQDNEWHWIYNKDYPEYDKPILTMKWNGMIMSSEATVTYVVDYYESKVYVENGSQYIKPGFHSDSLYNKTVAWQYINKPANVWEFLNHKTTYR